MRLKSNYTSDDCNDYDQSTQSNNNSIPTLTVTEYSNLVKSFLDNSFNYIYVVGETTNVKYYQNRMIFFSLKDQHSIIQCVIFNINSVRFATQLKEGLQIIVSGKPYYSAKGNLLLNIYAINIQGNGQLEYQYRLLKDKLAAEGLFDSRYKKKIPSYPKTIGIITSLDGAVIHDIIRNLWAITSIINIIIYPAKVQGTTAPSSLRKMLKKANERNECDVIVIARGGGSFEDLFCFNDEKLIREIRNSNIPVISAVGHESDYTLCDFASDLRVATPTEAGIHLSREYVKIKNQLAGFQNLITNKILEKLNWYKNQLNFLSTNLENNIQGKIFEKKLELAEIERYFTKDQSISLLSSKQYLIKNIESNLINLISQKLNFFRITINNYQLKIENLDPQKTIQSKKEFLNLTQRNMIQLLMNSITQQKLKINYYSKELEKLIFNIIHQKFSEFEYLSAKLNEHNPLTNPKFYHTITCSSNGQILHSTTDVNIDDEIITYLKDGTVKSKIIKIDTPK